MAKGKFITFEGIEGSGKSTQAKILSEKLKKIGYGVYLTFEPGDTEFGKELRRILLSPSLKITPLSELLLYFADRIQHLEEKILPSIEQGFIVISDRFTDSTVAYQGYGRGINLGLIYSLNRDLLKNFNPDLTVLLDLPVEIGLERNKKIKKNDKFEFESLSFHKRVREGFLEIASKDRERFIIIDATKSTEEVAEEVFDKIKIKLAL